MTKNQVDIEKIIEENYIVPESVFDGKMTKTSHFMLNALFPKTSTLTSTEYFINAFLHDEGFGSHMLPRPVFILFKVKPKDNKWTIIASKLRNKEEFLIEYFCGTQNGSNLIMMVFQVPDKWAKEYINFKAGKYSKFSEEYKKLFNRYTHDEKAQPIESIIWRVVHKAPELRKQLQDWIGRSPNDYVFTEEDELWGIPTPKYEHYRHVEPKPAQHPSS
jgi:hypothetical protein